MKQFNCIIKKGMSHWLIPFFCLLTSSSYGQYNLVPNGSFEDSVICPSDTIDLLPHPWYRPTIAMYQNGLYFNSCSTVWNASVPYNSDGYQYAHTGQAYAVIETFSSSTLNSERFYIQTRLKDSLINSKFYYSELYVSSVDLAGYGSNNISLLFTKKAIYADTLIDPNGVIVGNAQIYNYGNPIIADTMNWIKVSGIFKAQGGERYITIGNFRNGNQTNSKLINAINPKCGDCAGYYIDDVSVIPLDSMPLKADAGRDTTIHIGDSAFIGSLTNGIDSIKWQILNSNNTIDSIRPGFWVHPLVNTCYILTQTVNGFTSSDTVCVSVQTVPLKFISYSVISRNEKSVENIWQTANEINVSHFYVQRSTNGRDFNIIGKVNANGTSYNEYSFIDEAPNEGINYYRIVSVDRDGKKQYSEVKTLTINHSSLTTIDIFPNPTTSYVYINLPNKEKACWQITVTNVFGKKITEKEIRANVGKTFIELKGSKGMYFINVLNCSTGKQDVRKIILE